MSLTDSPITVQSDDLFGRAALANNLADFLLRFPRETSCRFGVYGEWGSGKTSVLELVGQSLEKRGHVTVWLLPWALGSSEAVLQRLLWDLAEKLGIGQKPWWRLSEAAEAGASATKLGEGLDLRITLAMRAARPVMDRVARSLKLHRGQELLTEIEGKLGEKRAVIIVDDLDRTPPAEIPEILLTLREAMSLPGVHYLLGLSPDIVRKGLLKAHPEWADESQDFLDKIVEYPFFLPATTDEDIRRATRGLIEGDSNFPHPKAILEVSPYLPNNPRRLKLFLRLVRSLSGQLSRYSADEIDLQGALLVQMLRLEFLSESLALIEDEEVVKSIEQGVARQLLGGGEELEKEAPEERFVLESPPARRKRFLRLCQAIRDRKVYLTELGLVDLYHLVDRPPVITWKEFYELLEVGRHGELALQSKLRELLEATDDEDKRRKMDAIWNRLIHGRERAWSMAIDADDQEAIRERLYPLGTIDALIRDMGIVLGSFRDGLLGPSHWLLFWKDVIDWDRFTNVPEYLSLRHDERSLALELASEMTDEDKANTWLQLECSIDFELHLEDLSPPLEELQGTLFTIFQTCAVNLALERFATPEGVEGFWGRHDQTPEKRVAFDSESAFHGSEARARLLDTAERAVDDVGIQRNFLTYLRMLLHGATEGSSFDRSQCRALLHDRDLLQSVWRAALASPLNPRVVGSLKRQLLAAEHAEITGIQLDRPSWWTAMEEEVPKPSGVKSDLNSFA